MRTSDASGLAREWLEEIEREWSRYCPQPATPDLRERLQAAAGAHLARNVPDIGRNQTAIVRATFLPTDTPVVAVALTAVELYATWMGGLAAGPAGAFTMRTEWLPLERIRRVTTASVDPGVAAPEGTPTGTIWTFTLDRDGPLVVRGEHNELRPDFGQRLFSALRQPDGDRPRSSWPHR